MNITSEIEKLKIKEKVLAQQKTLYREREQELAEKNEKLQPFALFFEALKEEIQHAGGYIAVHKETGEGLKWYLGPDGLPCNSDITKIEEEMDNYIIDSPHDDTLNLERFESQLEEIHQKIRESIKKESGYTVGVESLDIKIEYNKAKQDFPACYTIKFHKSGDWEKVRPTSEFLKERSYEEGWSRETKLKTQEEAEKLLIKHLAHKLKPQ